MKTGSLILSFFSGMMVCYLITVYPTKKEHYQEAILKSEAKIDSLNTLLAVEKLNTGLLIKKGIDLENKLTDQKTGIEIIKYKYIEKRDIINNATTNNSIIILSAFLSSSKNN